MSARPSSDYSGEKKRKKEKMGGGLVRSETPSEPPMTLEGLMVAQTHFLYLRVLQLSRMRRVAGVGHSIITV